MSDAATREPSKLGHTLVFTGLLLAGAAIYWFTRDRDGDEGEGNVSAAAESGQPATTAENEENEGRADGGENRERVSEYEALLELARRDLRAFRKRARDHVASHSPHAFDAIRALFEVDAPAAIPVLVDSIGDPQADDATRNYAFENLLPRAASDAEARHGLLAFLRLRPTDPTQRSSAFAEVLRWGGPDQVKTCMPLLEAETQPDVVVTAVQGLQGNKDAAARNRAQSLHWRHPSPEVRQRLRALGFGR